MTKTNLTNGQGCCTPTTIHNVDADGVNVFYRAAGDTSAPVVLLLHGFPASSFMFRELIPRLADHYRVIAPDLPGFGFTKVPAKRNYVYTFDALAKTIDAFTEAAEDQALRDLRVRLWCADRISFGDCASGADHSHRFAERERV